MFALCEYWLVHVITQKRLKEFWLKHPAAESPMRSWHKITRNAKWKSLDDLRRDFPTADYVAPWTIFNVGGNNYRIIAKIEYKFGRVFISKVFTHAEYDRWNA